MVLDSTEIDIFTCGKLVLEFTTFEDFFWPFFSLLFFVDTSLCCGRSLFMVKCTEINIFLSYPCVNELSANFAFAKHGKVQVFSKFDTERHLQETV